MHIALTDNAVHSVSGQSSRLKDLMKRNAQAKMHSEPDRALVQHFARSPFARSIGIEQRVNFLKK